MNIEELKKADTETLIKDFWYATFNSDCSEETRRLNIEYVNAKHELRINVPDYECFPNYHKYLMELDERVGKIPIEIATIKEHASASATRARIISEELETRGYKYECEIYDYYGKWIH